MCFLLLGRMAPRLSRPKQGGQPPGAPGLQACGCCVCLMSDVAFAKRRGWKKKKTAVVQRRPLRPHHRAEPSRLGSPSTLRAHDSPAPSSHPSHPSLLLPTRHLGGRALGRRITFLTSRMRARRSCKPTRRPFVRVLAAALRVRVPARRIPATLRDRALRPLPSHPRAASRRSCRSCPFLPARPPPAVGLPSHRWRWTGGSLSTTSIARNFASTAKEETAPRAARLRVRRPHPRCKRESPMFFPRFFLEAQGDLEGRSFTETEEVGQVEEGFQNNFFALKRSTLLPCFLKTLAHSLVQNTLVTEFRPFRRVF